MPKKKKRSRKPAIATPPPLEIPPFTTGSSGRNRFAARFADDPSSPPDISDMMARANVHTVPPGESVDRSPHYPMHSSLLEVIGGEIYDRVRLGDPRITINDSGENATASIAPPPRAHLFCFPLGQEGETLVQTNMLNAGQLDHPKKFTIRKMHLDILENGVPAEESSRFWWTSYVEVVIVSKSYLTLPAHALFRRPYEFESPIVLEGGMHFNVTFETLHTFDPQRKIEIAVRFSGTLSRAVQ